MCVPELIPDSEQETRLSAVDGGHVLHSPARTTPGETFPGTVCWLWEPGLCFGSCSRCPGCGEDQCRLWLQEGPRGEG